MADHINLYFYWGEQLSRLNDAETGALFKALVCYGRTGVIPALSGKVSETFNTLRPRLDADLRVMRAEENERAEAAAPADGDMPGFIRISELLKFPEVKLVDEADEEKPAPKPAREPVLLQPEVKVPGERPKSPPSFVPPTLDEVRSYCEYHRFTVDPVSFFNFYSEKGWRDSVGNPINNWRNKLWKWEEKKNAGSRYVYSQPYTARRRA